MGYGVGGGRWKPWGGPPPTTNIPVPLLQSFNGFPQILARSGGRVPQLSQAQDPIIKCRMYEGVLGVWVTCESGVLEDVCSSP